MESHGFFGFDNFGLCRIVEQSQNGLFHPPLVGEGEAEGEGRIGHGPAGVEPVAPQNAQDLRLSPDGAGEDERRRSRRGAETPVVVGFPRGHVNQLVEVLVAKMVVARQEQVEDRGGELCNLVSVVVVVHKANVTWFCNSRQIFFGFFFIFSVDPLRRGVVGLDPMGQYPIYNVPPWQAERGRSHKDAQF